MSVMLITKKGEFLGPLKNEEEAEQYKAVFNVTGIVVPLVKPQSLRDEESVRLDHETITDVVDEILKELKIERHSTFLEIDNNDVLCYAENTLAEDFDGKAVKRKNFRDFVRALLHAESGDVGFCEDDYIEAAYNHAMKAVDLEAVK